MTVELSWSVAILGTLVTTGIIGYLRFLHYRISVLESDSKSSDKRLVVLETIYPQILQSIERIEGKLDIVLGNKRTA